MSGWDSSIYLVILAFLISISCHAGRIKIPYAEDDCASYQNCTSCILDQGCGWCDSNFGSNCSVGTIDGPASSSQCSNGLWKYSSCNEGDVCSIQPNCNDCSSQKSCGWCDTRCVYGNFSGPNNQDIACNQWLYSSESCSSSSCTAYSTCSTCATQKNCGWCSQTIFGQTTCLLVSSEGTNADCEASSWYETENTCPETTKCTAYTNCTDCISDPSERCGWCKSNGTCINRDLEICKDFQENDCNEDCTNFRTCGDCSKISTCGWCSGSSNPSFCTYGDNIGPTYANQTICNTWSFDDCSAAVCNYNNCTDCNSQPDCAWCHSTIAPLDGMCYLKNNIPSNKTCSSCRSKSVTRTISVSESSFPSIAASPSEVPTRTSNSPTNSRTKKRQTSTHSPTKILLSATPSPSNSSSISATNSASNTTTPSTTLSNSRTSNPSKSASASRTSNPSRTSSPSNSTTPSKSLSNSASISVSISLSSSPSLSNSSSKSISHTSSRTRTRSPSASPTISDSSSQSCSKTATKSRTSSITTTPTITVTKSPKPTQTPTKSKISSPSNSPQISLPVIFSPSISQNRTSSASASPSQQDSNANQPQDSSTPWGFIVLICSVVIIFLIVIAGIGAWLFYRFYWLKRWYFQRLE